MMALRERLLLPVDAEEGTTSSPCGEVVMLSRLQMLGLGIAFSVGVCASPYIITHHHAMPMFESVSASDEVAMQVIPTPESFGSGFVKKLFKPFKPFAPALEFFGILLYCIPFLMFGYTHATDFSGFKGWLGSLGLPMPDVLAALGVFALLVGPLGFLSGFPTFVAFAGDLLGVFLIVATYFGHIVPLKSAEKGSWPYMFNMFMLLKNISLFGALGVIGWPIALKGEAAQTVKSMEPGYYFYLVIFTIGFLVPALMHLSKFNDFVGWVGSLGLPIPAKVAAVSGIAMLLIGCGLLYPGCPLLSEVGAEILLLFTLGATYYGHYKPMKSAATGSQEKQEQYMLALKNVGIMGCLLVIIAESIKKI